MVFIIYSCTKQLNFVFIDYPLPIKYLVIFRWHQIIRYLEVPTTRISDPDIKTPPPPANYILRHVPTLPRILRPPPPLIVYCEVFRPPPPPDIKTPANYIL